ncbi:MAG TPA: response regulator transcription factor [Bacteroidia bacterium]|nr:response regulator transcription factor [Bacteroidia bacterium]
MSEFTFKILLAEDDPNLGYLLKECLCLEGFEVELCKDGEIALQAFRLNNFDLCLLDVMMPKLNGFNLAQAIKAINSKIPIVFLTAKSLKEDKLKGYNLKADDYITKPFDEEELIWKIKAIRRRQREILINATTDTIALGNYKFNYKNQSLTINHDTKRITEKECEILFYLANHRNVIIKRQDLLTEIWGENDYFFGRSLDVFITKIRKYLNKDERISIENVFGVGFIFNVPEL